MAALCNRAGHYIFVLWLLSFFFFLSSFFPRLISAVADWMSTILLHMVWPYSANLECRCEMRCTWLAGNAGPKIAKKIRHLGAISQLCRAISSQQRHILTIGKKLVKQQYLLHMFSQHGELMAEICSREFGAPEQISTGFSSWLRYCSDVAQRRSTKLLTMFGRLLDWYTISLYTFSGALAP